MPVDLRHGIEPPATRDASAPARDWSPLDAARSLERMLANVPAAGWAAVLAADARSAFPHELCAAVHDWGFAEYLVPAEHGGRLRSLEELVGLARVLSRCDLTSAVALGASFLAALPVWLRGNDAQRRDVARLLRRGEFLAFALSEQAHGADLMAGEVTATRGATPGTGWCIDGTKWLINNAGHAAGATVTARTGDGVRGLTVFFVPRDRAGGDAWTPLPKIATHGLRGSALGGLVFTSLPVEDADVVGRVGHGLPLVLETLQITRVLVAGFALGALDTCLRAVLDFAGSRRLYGAPILELEPVRRGLTDVYADLLVAESLAHAAARAGQVAPEQLPLMSACAKYLVPALTIDGIDSLSVLLGARSYIAGEHEHGIVEKMRRDCAVTALFDGSAPVILNVIGDHLPSLARARGKGEVPDLAPELFAPDPPAPRALDPGDRELETEVDGIVAGTAVARARLLAERAGGAASRHRLLELLAWFETEVAALDARVAAASTDPEWRRSGECYDLAARYGHLHAAGACAHRWLALRSGAVDEFVAGGDWLVACLRRLATRLGEPPPAFDRIDLALLERVQAAAQGRLLFSALHVPPGPLDSLGNRSP